jgi:DNA polymerase
MAEEFNMTPEEAARQIRQRLESLRAAGIEFLPVSSDPLPVADASTADEEPGHRVTLFGEDEATSDNPASILPEQRRVALQLLAKEVAGCTRCNELASTRTQTVFGVGPPNPELCFIGEAPGRDEDLQGEPFVGPAGQLLNRILAAAGLKREEVYICNILRCRPPGNRAPRVEEAVNCSYYLEKTLELLQPRFICTLGASAAKYLMQLNPATTMGKLRKRFHDYKGIPVLCTYHPAYLLRLEEPEKTEKKREVWEDMKMLLNRMGKPIPGKG